ncbi:FAD-dependent monooxygenase [Pseudonocardia sp. NPDC046786]|uniref:FAD-dependent monooxygenase n=1 Tax=Pseudonocardia sp. NPDC046786 TaxID=3155471 RepID=UPI0033F7C2F1
MHVVVVDRRDRPLEVGQADGVACRTVEMFQAFGLADPLIAEGYQVNEVTFWRPDQADPSAIVRTGRVEDVEEGISEMPHMIVNQARMMDYLREHVRRSPSRAEPFHGLSAVDVRVDGGREHPVTVTLQHVVEGEPTGETSAIRARYAVGCDGARSAVRRALGLRLHGDLAHQRWGVMDVLVDTTFPDIRLKSAITSSHGSLLVIPREGGHLVRLYVELESDSADVTPDRLEAAVNDILHPYTLEVRHVGWWSVYQVAQRLCDRFADSTDEPRVFIAGDACHTHSAKAGQGMNVSMADAFNLGWKLGTVLRGSAPSAILRTYSSERQEVARQLIEFDREFAALFASRDAEPETFQRYFREQGRFTAGVAVRYPPSALTAGAGHQHLAEGFPQGRRFHSAPVVRLADAKPMQLGHAAQADGAWRLYVFADRTHPAEPHGSLAVVSERIELLVARYTPPGAEPDSVLDVRAVLQQSCREVSPPELPPVLRPRKGPFLLVDHEKVFCADPLDDVFDTRVIDRDGCVVVVRPDQYVAAVLPLDAHESLRGFLDGALVVREEPLGGSEIITRARPHT